MKKLMILILIALLISGCDNQATEAEKVTQETDFGYHSRDIIDIPAEELEEYSENTDYELIKWKYSGVQVWKETRKEWRDDNNLTDTAEYSGSDPAMDAHLIITTLEEYENILARIDEKREAVVAEIGGFREPLIEMDTIDREIDEAFFEENNLLLIDWCGIQCTSIEMRLEEIDYRFFHTSAEVTVSYSRTYGNSADMDGMIYWIPISKNCKDVDVVYNETAWKKE